MPSEFWRCPHCGSNMVVLRAAKGKLIFQWRGKRRKSCPTCGKGIKREYRQWLHSRT